MKKRKFDAVLFDIDGTILDTGEYIFQAYKHTLKLHFKREITWEDVVPVLGLPFEKCYRILTNLEEVDYLMESHHEFQARRPHLVKTYENALKTLEALEKAGVKIAAVTSHSGNLLMRNLKVSGVEKYFQVIITPDHVKNPKPDPESIFKALNVLKVKAKKAIFIGDSPADIEAGKRAGVKTIAALYGFHGANLLKTKPDYMVDDISQIPPLILGI